MWWFVFRTQAGLHLRAIGESPAAADAMGVDGQRLRSLYVIVGGAFAGLGGASSRWARTPAGPRA